MDAMVSARVPVEIKKQGDRKLKEMGSSATELVNAAYRYVLRYGRLPQAREDTASDGPRVKTLTGDAAQAFRDKWEHRSILEAREYTGGNFDEMLAQAREARYARFA